MRCFFCEFLKKKIDSLKIKIDINNKLKVVTRVVNENSSI